MSVITIDAMVVGAGVAGLYQLHRLREAGLTVTCVDAAPDIGGTWHWNCYPGARLDSPSYTYQYWFSEDLYNEWGVVRAFRSATGNQTLFQIRGK